MKQLLKIIIASLFLFGQSNLSFGQNSVYSEPLPCRSGEAMRHFYQQNPDALIESKAFESDSKNKTNTIFTYVIPVVFHVYGTTQNGYAVDSSIIQTALDMMNADFHGLNADFLTVHNQFSTIKSTLDIQFALAQLDTNGNSTNGIINHPVTSGYGNWNGYDSLIALDAWDNYKYMNIYIMNDLYNDGVTNNSGIAWYPNANMSNQRTARIVYNGAYLGTNCNSWNPEFASTLTHEYGHFLNLIHTFEGGCTSPNDNVSDTPPCTTAQGCPSSQTSNAPLNCNNDLVNSENYMDYNTTCYKMFTTGQVGRMVTALNHPARITLWQYSNLVATGLAHLVTGKSIENEKILLDVFPNPANEVLFFQLRGFQENCTLEILNSNGIVVYQDSVIAGKYSSEINCSKFTKGLYFISVKGDNFQEFKKIVLQ